MNLNLSLGTFKSPVFSHDFSRYSLLLFLFHSLEVHFMLVQQGNETIILSTYNGEETVREDREDGEDLDESTKEVLIFVDTLLNH